MVINAQNKEKYLEDLKNWLCELESAPLEEMGAFFRKRREENIPDDTFVHFDIPLTKEHEAELLKKVGFTVTVENGNDCLIIKAVK